MFQVIDCFLDSNFCFAELLAFETSDNLVAPSLIITQRRLVVALRKLVVPSHWAFIQTANLPHPFWKEESRVYRQQLLTVLQSKFLSPVLHHGFHSNETFLGTVSSCCVTQCGTSVTNLVIIPLSLQACMAQSLQRSIRLGHLSSWSLWENSPRLRVKWPGNLITRICHLARRLLVMSAP